MGTKKTFCGALVLAVSMLPAVAGAASISYYLSRSSQPTDLPDGTDYLMVTLRDGATPDSVDFTVRTLAPLNTAAVRRFGIQQFGFQLAGDAPPSGVSLSGLPSDWRPTRRDRLKMSIFGRFQFGLRGDGDVRQDPLRFTVHGVGVDGIAPRFAAYVAGFESANAGRYTRFELRMGPDGRGGSEVDDVDGDFDRHEGFDEHDGIESAYFGGGVPVAPVPLPAAAWLMLGGLAALGAFARRGGARNA